MKITFENNPALEKPTFGRLPIGATFRFKEGKAAYIKIAINIPGNAVGTFFANLATGETFGGINYEFTTVEPLSIEAIAKVEK